MSEREREREREGEGGMSLKTSLGNPFLYRKGKEGYYTYNVELSKMGRGEEGVRQA